MKVYILWGDEQIAPNEIRGIYATRELAEKHRGTGWCAITEHEVKKEVVDTLKKLQKVQYKEVQE